MRRPPFLFAAHAGKGGCEAILTDAAAIPIARASHGQRPNRPHGAGARYLMEKERQFRPAQQRLSYSDTPRQAGNSGQSKKAGASQPPPLLFT